MIHLTRQKTVCWRALIILLVLWAATGSEKSDARLVDYVAVVHTNCSKCGWRKSLGQHTKLSTEPVAYYANSTAARRILLLAGDIQVNPGPVQSTRLRNNQGDNTLRIQREDYLCNSAKAMSLGSNSLNIAHINIRSLRNKVDEVRLLLSVCKFDILSITETHLDDTISDRQLEVENYKIVRRDRPTGTSGGGCLVYVTTQICTQRMRSLENEQIEGIWLKLQIDSRAFIVGTIYRPSDNYNFFETFHQTLEKLWLKYKNVFIVGDLKL